MFSLQNRHLHFPHQSRIGYRHRTRPYGQDSLRLLKKKFHFPAPHKCLHPRLCLPVLWICRYNIVRTIRRHNTQKHHETHRYRYLQYHIQLPVGHCKKMMLNIKTNINTITITNATLFIIITPV